MLLVAFYCTSSVSATHVCNDGLDSLLLKRHSDAWAQERIAADQQGRSVDIQKLEESSPVYQKMRSISDTPGSPLEKAREFIKKYEKIFLQEDFAHVVRWAFRLDGEFGIEAAVKLRAIPFNKESSNQMKAYAVAHLGMPLAIMRLRAHGKKPLTAEEVLPLFESYEDTFLFIQFFGGRAEKQALLELRADLKKTRFWPVIEKTSYSLSLNQIIDAPR